jgi:hypothetical protein
MSLPSPSQRAERAARVKLHGSVLALLQLENGRNVRARLHLLSTTGGVLHLSKPLDERTRVEVMFHVGSTTVRTRAKMLFPMWATRGCLQPFSFTDLKEQERGRLGTDLGVLLEKAATVTSGAGALERL